MQRSQLRNLTDKAFHWRPAAAGFFNHWATLRLHKHEPSRVKAHVPQRICLGCGAVRPKQELLRLACNRQHEIVIDSHARLPGRGAYVCRRQECAELMRKKKSLPRSFRQPVATVVYQQVIEYLRANE